MGDLHVIPSLQIYKAIQFNTVNSIDPAANAGKLCYRDHTNDTNAGGTLTLSVENNGRFGWRDFVNNISAGNNITIVKDSSDPGKVTVTNKVETFVAAITENDLDINGVTYIGPLGNTDIDTANDCILVQVYTGPSASEPGSIVNVKVTKDEYNASYYKYLDIDFGSVAQFRNLNSSTVYAYITIIHGAQSVQCTSTHSGQPA